jgi:hypothetical protein
LLEICVHTSANDVPPKFTLLKIEGPDMEVPPIKADDLRRSWQAQLELTRDLGTAWLKKNESVLLRVPSVIVPRRSIFCSIHRTSGDEVSHHGRVPLSI